MFVSEKSVSKPIEITIDTEQRLALQREIDQQSQPTQLLKPSTSTTVGVTTLVEMKMEDDNCEENLIPKKKRRQKDLKSQDENKNCTADVKKEKKCKKVDTVAKEEKKKKWKLESNYVSDVTDEENGVRKKKKKKKQLLSDDEIQLQNIDDDVKEEKPEKKKSLLIKPERKKKEVEEETGKKIPKKDKKIKDILIVIADTEDHVKEKKKKKERPVTTDDSTGTKTKEKLKVEENEIKLEEAEIEKVKLKKKTKKEKTEKFYNGLDTTEIKSKKKKETKDEKNLKRKAVDDDEVHIKKTNILTQSEEGTDEGKAKRKKKSKKEKCRKVSLEDVIEVMEPKKKKKKKAKVEDEKSSKKDVTVAADTQKKKSKKNKTCVKVKQEFDAAVEAGAKKRKKNKEQHKDFLKEQDDLQSSKMDIVFLSQKSGNADEVNINQERRKALQMEINEASQPQNPTTPKGLGQWSTAQFDSTEQQQKFLRLMGGFKKGFQPAVETSGGGSMAMGKNAQQQLQQGLLGEFERAHSRRMDFNNKGAGLGFTASSSKKFSIDIGACRSVRFDD